MDEFQTLGEFAGAVYKAQVAGGRDPRLEEAEVEPEDCSFTEEELQEMEQWAGRLVEF